MAQEPLSNLIGFGILTPFRRGAADFVAGTSEEFIRSSVSQIFGVRAESAISSGEIPWRPEFGSILHLLRHRPNNAVTAELARVHVAEALARWLPQVRLQSVQIDRKKGPEGNENVLFILLRYDILATTQRGSDVLASDVQQTIEV